MSIVKYTTHHGVPQQKTCSASFQSKRITCPLAEKQQWKGGINQNHAFKTTTFIAPTC